MFWFDGVGWVVQVLVSFRVGVDGREKAAYALLLRTAVGSRSVGYSSLGARE